MCRKLHGSAFATYVAAPADGFRLLSGEERIARFESSPGFFRCFCSRCGSVVPEEGGGERVFMPAGCLEDDPRSDPAVHIFVASKAPWYEIADELPRFDAYPPGFDAPEREPESRPESDASAVRGSCLCNEVAWEVQGDVPLLVNCHCSRCRKARSAAHGSNLIVRPVERFRWVRGEDRVETYRLPDAERFSTSFCRSCGSAMPRVAPDFVVIAAGSVDGDPGTRPRLHIWVGSKAPWFEITDALPQFEESPPQAG
jgi:hypothetical protein